MAHNIKIIIAAHKSYRLPDADLYLPVQVGAAGKDKIHSDSGREYVRDDTGDNISKLNPEFCELTGLYWAWKNLSADYIGLVHYRRHFLLPENWMDIFVSNDVDVILPVPLYVAPSVEENYRQRHASSDWDNMLGYLKEHYPEERARACVFFKNGLLITC